MAIGYTQLSNRSDSDLPRFRSSTKRSHAKRRRFFFFFIFVSLVSISGLAFTSARWRKAFNEVHIDSQLKCMHRQAASHFTSSPSSSAPLTTTAITTPLTLASSFLIDQSLSLRRSPSSNSSIVPPLIHQSWSSTTIPRHLVPTSQSWTRDYPEWTHLLWTDADNLALVRDYYPEFLEAYQSLPREIWRADMIRPLYMHAFGGIYVDLDMDSIHPLIHEFNQRAERRNAGANIAFVAQMGNDTAFPHSVPNAFMASTKGHPFWLQFARGIVDRVRSGSVSMESPEYSTGPVALWEEVNKYNQEWSQMHQQQQEKGDRTESDLEILPPSMVFPHSWKAGDASPEATCLCWSRMITFDRLKCQALYPQALAITYWNHQW